jgi:hypothetical protein
LKLQNVKDHLLPLITSALSQEPFVRFIQGHSWEQEIINVNIPVKNKVSEDVAEEGSFGIFFSDAEKNGKIWETHLNNVDYWRLGDIRHQDISTLGPNPWLNDTIINVYTQLLQSVTTNMKLLPTWMWSLLSGAMNPSIDAGRWRTEESRRKHMLVNQVSATSVPIIIYTDHALSSLNGLDMKIMHGKH